jgi:hypothetical protein
MQTLRRRFDRRPLALSALPTATPPRTSGRFCSLALLLALLLSTGPAALAQVVTSDIWTTVPVEAVLSGAERQVVPDRFRTVRTDQVRLSQVLAAAPLERVPFDTRGGVVLSLPTPAGDFLDFEVIESSVMAPELQARYPQIRSYYGRAVDHPATVARISMTPDGFRALVLGDESYLIDPLQRGDATHLMVYSRADYTPETERILEAFRDHVVIDDGIHASPTRSTDAQRQNGAILRTYRTAVAATGEYTAFHGGTVAAGLAAINVTMTRVNGVYERDFSVRMVLVANNDVIVYTDPATDPYTNNSGSHMLSQNQTNLDAVIGSANYDIGHVFSTGGGGVARLGSVCRAGLKAQGVTGLSQPTNDVFHIDYVAHEIGHQFRANHTFNGNASSCGGGNRNASTAYEPGSGSTIMAYAGICASHNLQPNSDDYFHTISLDEVVDFITTGFGSGCGTATPTANAPPVVTSPHGGLTIPAGTPFFLSGSATDDGPAEALRYTWEQFNLGPAGSPAGVGAWAGTAPHFRSFSPVVEPIRYFPALDRVLANQAPVIGEGYPLAGQTLAFRLTARDNAGGIGDTQISIAVDAVAGPFLVTFGNDPDLVFEGNSNQEITWDVAGTDANGVNATHVDILYSGNNGASFDTVLADAVPNTGSALVQLPNSGTGGEALGRIKVVGTGNVFFSVNAQPFIVNPSSNTAPIADAGPDQTVIAGQTVTLDGSASSDPDGDDLTYAWTLNGPGYTDEPLTGVGPMFCAADPGSFTASLVVNDGTVDSEPDEVTVTAITATAALDALLADVEALRVAGVLNNGQARGLSNNLISAQRHLARGNTNGALGTLAGFRDQALSLWQNDGVLTEEQAMALVDAVDAITGALAEPCSTEAEAPIASSGFDASSGLPTSFALEAAFPNPLRSSATLSFDVAEASDVRVVVYDVQGRQVAVLAEGRFEAASHQVVFDAADCRAGCTSCGCRPTAASRRRSG